MSYQGQVHHLLDRGRGKEREPCLTYRVDVRVIPKDGKGMGGNGPGRDVKNRWHQFPGDLVHVGNHQ